MLKYATALLLAFAMMACDAATTTADEVPAAVRSAFEAAYPGATDVDWETEVDGNYQVEFEMNGEDMEVEFSPTGEMLEADMD